MANRRVNEPLYTPTREQIERECERIRVERVSPRRPYNEEPLAEYEYTKHVYRHPHHNGRRLLKRI